MNNFVNTYMFATVGLLAAVLVVIVIGASKGGLTAVCIGYGVGLITAHFIKEVEK